MSRIGGLWPLAVGLAAVLLAVPLWAVATPGMPDYPAHLASFALIAGEASRYYIVQWAALPNLASEAAVPLLAQAMSLEAATRLFLTLTVALWVIGPALIQRALSGRVEPGVLLCAFFAYNANFIWGFFNYSFTVGLGFVVFAAWIATDGRRRLWHQLAFLAAFTLIYFCHLFGLAVLLLAIGGYEISGLIEERMALRALRDRVLLPALLCIPAALAFFLLKPAAAGVDKFDFNLADTVQDRFESAIEIGFDKPVLVLTGMVLVLFVVGMVTGRAKLHPRMRIVVGLLAAAALFAPEWAMGGWGVHMRLPAVLGALSFAALTWNVPARAAACAAAVILVLLAIGAGLLASDWQRYDAQYSEFRNREGAIAPGARLLTVLDGDSLGWAADQPYWHMAEFAVMDRGAFTPLMFTTAGQHIVRLRPPFDRHAAATAEQGSPPDIDELDDLAHARLENDEDYLAIYPYLIGFQCHFDEALVIHGAGPHSAAPTMLRKRAEGSFFTLYDILPDKSCAGQ